MPSTLSLYIGTYTDTGEENGCSMAYNKSEGIYHGVLNSETGDLTINNVTTTANPSYLVTSNDKNYLYCVNELNNYNGEKSGSVSSFRISSDGKLQPLNTQPTMGADPCYISLDRSGGFLLASNYSSGSVTMFPIKKDGSSERPLLTHKHEGKGSNPVRQEAPHAHSVVFSPSEKYAIVADLGIDKLMVYSIDKEDNALNFSGKIPLNCGDGPRHSIFHPTCKNLLYVITELTASVKVIDFNENTGTGKILQSMKIISTDAEQKFKNNDTGNSSAEAIDELIRWQDDTTGADIHISPDGRFLFVSIRGNNVLASLKIDSKTGFLSVPDFIPCGGKTPRGFTISPNGEFLLCANQDSNTIAVFRINKETGLLKFVSECYTPKPVCLRFV